MFIDGSPRGPVPACPLPLIHADSVASERLTVPRDEPFDGTRADDQLAAVPHASGPARVMAPTGSGKTGVLVARLHHRINRRGVEAGHMTAIAYNARAAAQMRQRIGTVVVTG